MNNIFYFGGERVGNRPIKKGLLYQDERGKEAKVMDYFDGIVILDWQDSGRDSQCSERQFRKRFSLYGYGHGSTPTKTQADEVGNHGQL